MEEVFMKVGEGTEETLESRWVGVWWLYVVDDVWVCVRGKLIFCVYNNKLCSCVRSSNLRLIIKLLPHNIFTGWFAVPALKPPHLLLAIRLVWLLLSPLRTQKVQVSRLELIGLLCSMGGKRFEAFSHQTIEPLFSYPNIYMCNFSSGNSYALLRKMINIIVWLWNL